MVLTDSPEISEMLHFLGTVETHRKWHNQQWNAGKNVFYTIRTCQYFSLPERQFEYPFKLGENRHLDFWQNQDESK